MKITLTTLANKYNLSIEDFFVQLSTDTLFINLRNRKSEFYKIFVISEQKNGKKIPFEKI